MRDNDLAKNLGKTNKEVTDTLQKNNMEENSSMTNGAGTQPAGENKEGAAPAKKRIAAVYRPQNSTQKGRGGRSQGQGARNQRSTGPGMQVRPTTSAPAQKPKAAPAEEVKEQTTAPVQETETAPVQAASQTEARPQGSRQGNSHLRLSGTTRALQDSTAYPPHCLHGRRLVIIQRNTPGILQLSIVRQIGDVFTLSREQRPYLFSDSNR